METIQRNTTLTEFVIRLCRYLRSHAFDVGVVEEQDILKSLSFSIPRTKENLKILCKAIVSKTKEQSLQFETLFDDYWDQLEKADDSKISNKKSTSPNLQSAPSIQALKSWLYNGKTDDKQETASFSAAEAFAKKDFSSFRNTEIPELKKIISLLSKNLNLENTRRYIASKKSHTLDIKKTISKNLRKGDSLDHLFFKKRKKSKLKILLFCDVSKSMDLYSRFLIQFLFGLQNRKADIHTFVFSTSLSHISQYLKNTDFNEALENLSTQVTHWSGGTDIGKCFEEYRLSYGRKYLDRRTHVIILSDGWDQGDPNKIRDNMAFFKKHSKKIVWLNPLAGNPDYKAKTMGMEAAMPYVDIFASAHNLESLANLSSELRKGLR